MMKRKPIKKYRNKKLFRKTVNRTHKFNMQSMPMRGGIRM